MCPGTSQPTEDPVHGEIICMHCGVVLESHTVGHNGEANIRNIEQIHDHGIGTAPPKIKLVNSWTAKVSNNTSKDNSLIGIFRELAPILSNIAASNNIKDEAYTIARKAVAKNITRGRPQQILAAACVLLSCRTHGKQIPDQEIFSAANVPKKYTRKMFRLLLQHLEVAPLPIFERTRQIICRMCSDLGVNRKTRTEALDMLDILQKKMVSGQNPNCVAGALIYIASGNKVSREQIAIVGGVTGASIRNVCKKITHIFDDRCVP